jgi:hypothetical protein
MATDLDIATRAKAYLRAHGYTCGRNYADIGGLAEGIKAFFPEERRETFRTRVERAVQSTSGFKFNYRGDVSASASDDPSCGSD